MTSVNAANFRRDAGEYLNRAIRLDEVIRVDTDDGNAVILNGETYRNIMETLYLTGHPRTAREVLDGMRTDWDEGEIYDPSEAWE